MEKRGPGVPLMPIVGRDDGESGRGTVSDVGVLDTAAQSAVACRKKSPGPVIWKPYLEPESGTVRAKDLSCDAAEINRYRLGEDAARGIGFCESARVPFRT